MKKQLVIEEISRIAKLMFTNQINESFLIDDAISKFSNFMSKNDNLKKTLASELGIPVNQLTDDILKINDKDELANIINKFIFSSETFRKEITPFLMSNLSDDVMKGINNIKTTIVDEIKNDKTLKFSDVESLVDDFINSEVKTPYPLIKDRFKENLKTQLRNDFSSIRGGKKPINTPIGKIERVGKTWFDSIKACGLNTAELALMTKVIPLRKLRSLSRVFFTNITTLSDDLEMKALEKVFSNLKQYTQKFENEGVDDIDLLRNANSILLGLKKDKKALVSVFRDEVIKAIKDARGPNGELVKEATLQKLRNGLNTNIPYDVNQPSWVKDVLGGDYMPEFLRKLTKIDKKNFDTWLYNFLDTFFGGFLSSGVWKNINELCSLIERKGIRVASRQLSTIALLTTKLIAPLFFGVLLFFADEFAAGFGFVDPMETWYDRAKRDVLIPLKKLYGESGIGWLINPFAFYWDEVGSLLSTGLEMLNKGSLKPLIDKIKSLTDKTVSETNRVFRDRTGRDLIPTPSDSTTTPTPTDSTTTTDTTTITPPPSLTSDVQNFDSRWLNVATFTKVNENTYKMKFTTDQNKLSRNEIPSDWAGKETEAKKTNDGWVFTLGDQGPFPLEQ
jgi:hypothetical protein